MTPRTALVTGATSGIGLATARRLLDNGYDVVGTSRNPERIPAGSRLEGVRYRGLDLTDIYAIEGFVTAIGAEGIHVDIVVNNAGESRAVRWRTCRSERSNACSGSTSSGRCTSHSCCCRGCGTAATAVW